MTGVAEVLPRTTALVDRGMAKGLHIGWQVAVHLGGKVIVEDAVGDARVGQPMSSDTMMIWFSSTKATTAVATAQLWERGTLDLDDPVVAFIPEFGSAKAAITIRHLLTHTAGLRFADYSGGTQGAGGGMAGSWAERLARICAADIEEGWVPGHRAGYHPTSGMHLLGEIVQRVDGRSFPDYVREEIFEPLGMRDSWIGMPPDRYDDYGPRIGSMHNTRGGQAQPLPVMDSRDVCSSSIPGAGGRGPMRDLVRLYDMFLGRGTLDGTRILTPQTVEAMSARHRVGLRDESFGAVVDWGLGLAVDVWHYGRRSSPRSFGHGGAGSSVGFADPEFGLAVAYVFNGMPAPADHAARMLATSTAIYDDLGIDSPLRDKQLFRGGLM